MSRLGVNESLAVVNHITAPVTLHVRVLGSVKAPVVIITCGRICTSLTLLLSMFHGKQTPGCLLCYFSLLSGWLGDGAGVDYILRDSDHKWTGSIYSISECLWLPPTPYIDCRIGAIGLYPVLLTAA